MNSNDHSPAHGDREVVDAAVYEGIDFARLNEAAAVYREVQASRGSDAAASRLADAPVRVAGADSGN